MSKRVVSRASWVLVLVIAAAAIFLLTRSGSGDAGAAGAGSGGAAAHAERTDRRGPKSDRDADAPPPGAAGSVERTLSGRVVDADGAPVVGAQACAWREEDAALRWGPRCRPVEVDGTFSIGGLAPGRYEVSAMAAGRVPARAKDGPFDLAAGDRDGIVVTLPAGGVTLRGVVRDRFGEVVAGALVSVAPDWLELPLGVFDRTDTRGRFELTVPKGRVVLSAEAPGYVRGKGEAISPADDVVLVLLPGASLAGRVVDPSGAPVAGVTVDAAPAVPWPRERSAAQARTGDDGGFVLEGLRPGRYRPAVRDRGWYGQADQSVALGLLETSKEVVVRVRRGARVEGRVVEEGTGEGCEGASAHLRGKALETWISGEPGEHGAVVFETVPPDDYEVGWRCPGHAPVGAPAALSVREADVTGLTLTVRAGGTLHGEVVDGEGRPVPGVRVGAFPDTNAMRGRGAPPTDEAGRFEIEGLTPGRWRVTPGTPMDPATVLVTVPERGAPDDVRLVVASPAHLRGTVLDGKDAPVPYALLDLEGATPKFLRTGLDGAFSADVGAGHWVLKAMPPRQAIGRLDVLDARAFDLAAGESKEVTLHVGALDGVIRGRVVDGRGAPVADAFVEAVRGGHGLVRHPVFLPDAPPALTGADGAFSIEGLADGAYLVHAWRGGASEARREGVHPGEEVVLTLPDAARVAGRVVLASGGAPRLFRVTARSPEQATARADVFSDEGGRFALDGLPPGKTELGVTAVEGSASATLTLAPGESREDVRLEIEGLAAIRARVVDEAGAPLPEVPWTLLDPVEYVTVKSGKTGEDGRLAAADVPLGRYALRLAAPGGFASFRDREVRPAAGENDLGDLVLVRRAAGGAPR